MQISKADEEGYGRGILLCRAPDDGRGCRFQNLKDDSGISAKEVYPGLMETFVKEKAARFEGDRFVLTDYGLDVSNYIMAQFLQD